MLLLPYGQHDTQYLHRPQRCVSQSRLRVLHYRGGSGKRCCPLFSYSFVFFEFCIFFSIVLAQGLGLARLMIILYNLIINNKEIKKLLLKTTITSPSSATQSSAVVSLFFL